MTSLRWFLDPPADGPGNMACDEALLQCVGRGASSPALRFYGWSPPTISLGYFQSYAEFEALPPPAGELAVVRRQTGGGAILHDLELTYALALPLDHPWIAASGSTALYQRVHAAFAQVLGDRGVSAEHGPENAAGSCARGGPFFCFERHSRFDLLVNGRKLMGSAQRRTAGAVLQHGSLILRCRYAQQACASVAEHADVDVLSCLPSIVEAIAGTTRAEPGGPTPEELELAQRLRDKYADPMWTRQR